MEELMAEARRHGLPPDRETPFILWLGQEIAGGREVSDFTVLTARARDLYLMFRNEEAVQGRK
jgi:hypothetical protein